MIFLLYIFGKYVKINYVCVILSKRRFQKNAKPVFFRKMSYAVKAAVQKEECQKAVMPQKAAVP